MTLRKNGQEFYKINEHLFFVQAINRSVWNSRLN